MGILDRARAKALLLLMSKGTKVKQEDVPSDIPSEWTIFPGTEGYWIELPFPESENASACLYKARRNSIFPPHFHLNASENITIMNPGGKIRLVTESGVKDLEYPASIHLEKEEIHAVRFLTQTTISVVWRPKMNGFDIGLIDTK